MLGRGEKVAASVDDETAGGRNGERSGDVDGTNSSAADCRESANAQQCKNAMNRLTKVARAICEPSNTFPWSP